MRLWALAVLLAIPFAALADEASLKNQDIRALNAAAEKGDVRAQYRLGYDYVWGFGLRKDPAKAIEWWRKSAAQNYPQAEFVMGSAYDEGRGVAQDKAEAIKWIQKAVEHGSPNAKFLLAVKYESADNGLKQDHEKAQRLWQESIAPLTLTAEKGDVVSQCNLGIAYLMGWGVTKDSNKGMQWLIKAAEQGDPLGETVLANMYRGVEGVTRDDAESVKWFQRAAEQSSDFAQLQLGMAYAHGVGVPEDKVKAYMWLDVALAQGIKEAAPHMMLLAQKMTPKEHEAARTASHDWQAAHLAGHP